MYYKERTEFGTLSLSSDPTVDDNPLDELCRSAEIDRREPVRPAASHNSMADERTASNFTWFNSSLRNRQDIGTLTWMIQIRQWALHLVRFFMHTQEWSQ